MQFEGTTESRNTNGFQISIGYQVGLAVLLMRYDQLQNGPSVTGLLIPSVSFSAPNNIPVFLQLQLDFDLDRSRDRTLRLALDVAF